MTWLVRPCLKALALPRLPAVFKEPTSNGTGDKMGKGRREKRERTDEGKREMEMGREREEGERKRE